jgi:hypothetical protein
MEAQPNTSLFSAPGEQPTTLDLSSYLNAPTVNVTKPDFDQELVDNTNPDDFEPDDELDESDQEPEEEKTYRDYLDDAGLFINLFDSLQTGILTPAHRAKMMEPDDSAIIARFKEEQKLIKSGQLHPENATIDTDVALDAIQRESDYKASIKTIPFTAKEKGKLKEPLAKVIHKYQGMTVSPEMALLLSVLMIMAPRIIGVLPEKWGDKFSSVATLGMLKNAKAE